MLRPIRERFLFSLLLLVSVLEVHGQLDPEQRRLVQVGYNQPVEGRGPIAGYGFYYHNQPNFLGTNMTLRLAVAPIYLDGELGFKHLLSPQTDFAVGLAGGGFAYSHSEVRGGNFFREESFTGHGGEISASVYHLFNPNQTVPLYLVVRGSGQQVMFERDNNTAEAFGIPDDQTVLRTRTGLRYGGQEPTMTAPLAMELSVWHESAFRLNDMYYGYAGDRSIEAHSHLFWGRALLKYTFENEQLVEGSITLGTSADADRLSAYRLGGVLPFASEFPLSIPGYYFQELSASRFVLANLQYSFPLTPGKSWRFTTFGATGLVDYLSGLEQSGTWHSGLGGGLSYISPTGAWMITAIYGHGFDAIRDGERGANQVGILLQWDLDARSRGKSRFFMPGVSPYKSRAGEKLFGR